MTTLLTTGVRAHSSSSSCSPSVPKARRETDPPMPAGRWASVRRYSSRSIVSFHRVGAHRHAGSSRHTTLHGAVFQGVDTSTTLSPL